MCSHFLKSSNSHFLPAYLIAEKGPPPHFESLVDERLKQRVGWENSCPGQSHFQNH